LNGERKIEKGRMERKKKRNEKESGRPIRGKKE
jgi:hypothetical protein